MSGTKCRTHERSFTGNGLGVSWCTDYPVQTKPNQNPLHANMPVRGEDIWKLSGFAVIIAGVPLVKFQTTTVICLQSFRELEPKLRKIHPDLSHSHKHHTPTIRNLFHHGATVYTQSCSSSCLHTQLYFPNCHCHPWHCRTDKLFHSILLNRSVTLPMTCSESNILFPLTSLRLTTTSSKQAEAIAVKTFSQPWPSVRSWSALLCSQSESLISWPIAFLNSTPTAAWQQPNNRGSEDRIEYFVHQALISRQRLERRFRPLIPRLL